MRADDGLSLLPGDRAKSTRPTAVLPPIGAQGLWYSMGADRLGQEARLPASPNQLQAQITIF